MYGNTLNVANKIISDTDLIKIFQLMNEDLIKYQSIFKHEQQENIKYDTKYQHWTLKDFSGYIKAEVNFYDDTRIDFDNYNNFISIFNTRLDDIKSIWLRYSYSYYIKNENGFESVSKYIYMNINENKIDIDAKINSSDDKMEDVYNLINEIILHAPTKNDRIIVKKNLICNKIIFSIGFIPSLIICYMLAFVNEIRLIYKITYITFPILNIILSLIIGGTVYGGKLDKLYKNLIPNKKYAGYDYTNNQRLYKDDIDDYISTGEIIIGKNANNIKYRKEILELEKKITKRIPIEIFIFVISSILIILLSK